MFKNQILPALVFSHRVFRKLVNRTDLIIESSSQTLAYNAAYSSAQRCKRHQKSPAENNTLHRLTCHSYGNVTEILSYVKDWPSIITHYLQCVYNKTQTSPFCSCPSTLLYRYRGALTLFQSYVWVARQPSGQRAGPRRRRAGFKSQPRRCPVTLLGKLFTHIVPLFTKQQN